MFATGVSSTLAGQGLGTLNAQGVATFATTSLAVGTQMITASYGGDSNFTMSASSAVRVVAFIDDNFRAKYRLVTIDALLILRMFNRRADL